MSKRNTSSASTSVADRIVRARERAVSAAPHLRVTEQHVEWSYDKAIGVFTPEWQEQAHKRAKRSRRLAVFGAHPFLNDLTIGDASSTSAVMEMAAYIDAFESDPAFSGLAASLRSTEGFESTRFELAMAYRFHLTDASVQLQPSIGQRKADFEVRLGESSWVCECTCHRVSAEQERCSAFLHEIGDRILTITQSHLQGITLKVNVRRLGDARDCSMLISRIKAMAREWQQRPWHTYAKSDEFAEIRLSSFCDADDPNPLQNGEETDWSLILDSCRAKRSELDRLVTQAMDKTERQCVARAFIRTPTPPSRDLLPGLLQRVRKKLSQISATSPTQFRIVLVEALGNETDYDLDAIKTELTDIMAQRRDVAGLAIMFRRLGENLRYRYGGFVAANRECAMGIPANLAHGLNALEEFGAYPMGRI